MYWSVSDEAVLDSHPRAQDAFAAQLQHNVNLGMRGCC
jgi:hypothetical protein